MLFSDQLFLEDLGIIAVFAPRYKSQILTGEVVELYCAISHQLSRKMESTLYSVIYAMIDAYFDDENEYEEMINMINENTTVETIEKFESLDIFKNKVLELEKIKATLEKKKANLEKYNANLEKEKANLEKYKANLEKENANLKAQIKDLKL